ncbi:MAG: hypothetical protein V1875_07545 [Candidatus Altiarchaeota archaeon]
MLALLGGCLTETETVQTTTTTTATPAEPSTTTTSTATTTPSSTSTTLAVNGTQLCQEARQNESVYQRCKKAATGQIHLPQSELQRCAQIQQHAGEYARNIYHGLTYCIGLPSGGLPAPGEGASFCKDLPEENQDDCYMTVRQCDKIADPSLRNRCAGLNELS